MFGGVDDHRLLAADKASADVTSGLSDPMARQAAMEATREAQQPPGSREATQNNDVMGATGGNESLLPESNRQADDNEGLFGMGGGVIHPYVTIGTEYTDNLYNVDKNRVSGMTTFFNPGIWLSLPGKKQIPVTLAPNNPSTGGYQYEMADYGRADRLQLFLLGDLEYRMYSEDSNLSEWLYRLQGMARYNFPSGLSLQILDAYTHGQDRFDIGYQDSRLTHVFDSNSVMGTVDWLMTEKFQARADLSLFTLRYNEREFAFMERDDWALDLHFYYHYSEKTAFYLEYKYIDTQYDSNTLYNSTSNEYYVGVAWDATDKLSFLVRVGLREKFYDNNQFSDWSGLAFGLQSTFRLTDKSKFTGEIYRNNEETDMLSAEDRITTGAALGYDVDITDKVSVGIRGLYEYGDYRRRPGYSYYPDPTTSEEYYRDRTDTRWAISGQVNYLFNQYLKASIGYRYENRSSTIDIYDYYANTVFALVQASL
jgi:hypothetical protein